nr:trna wybutosine-synthesizing protein 2/3/4 [Quercus suber]
MDYTLELIFVLKAWRVVVLVIGILGNWKLAEGDNEHAGRKLVDHVPEKSGDAYNLPTHTPNPTQQKIQRWLLALRPPRPGDSVISLLFPDSPTHFEPEPESKLVLRFEPLIVAVECKDLASAQSLVSTARSAGFRESDITNANNKRVIVAIRCSIRLEVPLGTT